MGDAEIKELIEKRVQEAREENELALSQSMFTPDPFYDWAEKKYGLRKVWHGVWYKPWTWKWWEEINYPDRTWRGEAEARRLFRQETGYNPLAGMQDLIGG